MPILHITLDCSTPTSHPDGEYRTLVAVTHAELRDGLHLREASRRAAILGFGGPHRVVVSKELFAFESEMPASSDLMDGDLVPSAMGKRLDTLLNGCTASDDVSELTQAVPRGLKVIGPVPSGSRSSAGEGRLHPRHRGSGTRRRA